MLPAGGNPLYYVEDMLGSSRIVAQNNGVVCYDADFYPYGGERPVTNTCPQNYKFEGKERDTETGNDDFGARYYSSRFGRWLSADWSNVPVPVPYANLTNPQTLNLYAMVSDDPESFADLDGHGTEPNGPPPKDCMEMGGKCGLGNHLVEAEQDKTAQQPQITLKDLYNAIGKTIANALIAANNLGNELAASVSSSTTPPKVTPELQASTSGEAAAMKATGLALLVIPESKAGRLGEVGVALREEKIVKQVETVAEYSNKALMSSARKAISQIEKHFDLLKSSGAEAARSIKVDLRHNAERLEAIIREVVKRNAP